MGNGGWRGSARWVAGLAGTSFQVGATVVAGAYVSEVVSGGLTSLVEPTDYAFGVWAMIFLLSLLFAGYQALPANREGAVFRRVGWPVAGAFLCTGLWSVPPRQSGLAQVMLLGIFALLLIAYLRLARSDAKALGRAERWLVSLTVGIPLGWVTSANAVSLTPEAVRLGLVDARGAGEVLVGSALLISGGLLAAAITRAAWNEPPQGYAAFAVAGPVLVSSLRALRGGRTRPGGRRIARPGGA